MKKLLLGVMMTVGLLVSGGVSLANDYTPCDVVTDIPKEECEALVDFYYSMNGDGWITGHSQDVPENKPWLTGNTVASWYGVNVSGGHVVTLSLVRNDLLGSIIDSFGNLTYLQGINLRGNEISGSLPMGMQTLTQLKTVDLGENNLSATFPEVIRYWKDITILTLPRNTKEGGNTFSGGIPSRISELTKMQSFNINGCKVGSLPKEIFEINSLTSLLVENNNLTFIPSELFISQVTTLNLGNNKLSGTLLSGFAMKPWSTLYFHGNNFEGEIPLEWGNLKLSNILNLSQNKLSGSLLSGFIGMGIKNGGLFIDNNCLDIEVPNILSGWVDQKSASGSGWRTAQNACIIPLVPTPTTPSYGGGGSVTLRQDVCPEGDFSPSYYDRECGETSITNGGGTGLALSDNNTPTDNDIPTDNTPPSDNASIVPTDNEIGTAYQRAYNLGITTLSPFEAANPEGFVLRSHMAKMIVPYAVKVLEMKPDTSKPCLFTDIATETEELQTSMILACQLGIMGIHTDGSPLSAFSPNELITRAQFGTILSRILYGTLYNEGDPYYINHLQALQKSGIMTQIDTPEQRQELRQRVWLMLMRSKK